MIVETPTSNQATQEAEAESLPQDPAAEETRLETPLHILPSQSSERG